MIGLSTKEYHPSGALLLAEISNSTKTRDFTRRISKVKTLDGGVAVTDFGYAVGDRTMTVAVRTDQALFELLVMLGQLTGSFVLTNEDGAYSVYLTDFSFVNGIVTIQLTVEGLA